MKTLSLMIFLILGGEHPAQASRCADIEFYVKRDWDSAKAVFLGIAEDSCEVDSQQPPSIKTKFKVVEDFKGNSPYYEVIVSSSAFKLYRDIRFIRGKAYLVMADGDGTSLFTNLCTSTEFIGELELKGPPKTSASRALQWLQAKAAKD